MARILLIDDDPDVRFIMNSFLQKNKHVVDTASNKAEALLKLAESEPDLILLDVLLSGADGREICRAVKAETKLKTIPVIMFSAHPGAAENYEVYGADDFITKPINTEILLQKINRQLQLAGL